MNERYYFYRCTDPKNAPPYAFYDYSNGLVGYPNKLAEPVAKLRRSVLSRIHDRKGSIEPSEKWQTAGEVE